MSINVLKVDSNSVGLRYCKETTIGTLPTAASQTWYPLEPNTFKDFGGKIKTVARQPINAGRQIQKGLLVDLDAVAQFDVDLTYNNLQDLFQGFMYSAYLRKTEEAVAAVGTNSFSESTASSQLVGNLVLGSGFTNIGNNGTLMLVSSVSGGTVTISNVSTFTESPPAGAKIVQVGYQFALGDAQITAATFPSLTSTVKTLTQLGLNTGEWVFLGGDQTTHQFAQSVNNGYARVYSVAQNMIQFDKTSSTMVTDTSTASTVQLFMGRVITNQQPPNIVRSTYTLEEQLGYNNTNATTLQQAQYISGAVPDTLTINVKAADKVTVDIGFVGTKTSTIDENVSGANTLLSKAATLAGSAANSPSIVQASAFNTSSNDVRTNLSAYTPGTSNPAPLFAFVSDFTLDIKNNAKPEKAVGVLGAFEVSVGFFEVTGKITAFFTNTESINTVQTNANITFDTHLVQNNQGISIDIPVITLGGGIPKVVINKPIDMDFDLQAGSGIYDSTALNHTLMISFFDWIPTLAANY